jgi:hypothetical protein
MSHPERLQPPDPVRDEEWEYLVADAPVLCTVCHEAEPEDGADQCTACLSALLADAVSLDNAA